MKSLLGVNIDHVATLREVRRTSYPDLIDAAEAALKGGADQITVHLREDRRHIQDGDVAALKKWGKLPLNLEMAAHQEIVAIACRIKPSRVTLVPERRQELTTERGLDVAAGSASLKPTIERLLAAGIVVSLFIDPEEKQIEASKALSASDIEVHTGAYCDAKERNEREKELHRLQQATLYAERIGLRVCAGHGLTLSHLPALVCTIPHIVEYNIGHAIVARSIFIGLEQAVREIKLIVEGTL